MNFLETMIIIIFKLNLRKIKCFNKIGFLVSLIKTGSIY